MSHHHDHEAGSQDPSGGHAHGHDAAGLRELSRRRLWLALAINLVFLAVEVVGGLLSNSLALLADAGHMFTDVAALGLALVVSYLAGLPATPRRTFGFVRAEVLGAFVNGASLVLVVGLIFREAWLRLSEVQAVQGPLLLGVAGLGLAANLVSAWILAGSRKENVNVEAAFLHMAADALGSVGAIVAGVVIWTTGWTRIDPLVSVVIGVLILGSSVGLLRTTMNILLETTPEYIDYLQVKAALEGIEHVEAVHDLHIWNISRNQPILSAHLSLASGCCESQHWPECLAEARRLLQTRFGINHTTLQVEPAGADSDHSCRLE